MKLNKKPAHECRNCIPLFLKILLHVFCACHSVCECVCKTTPKNASTHAAISTTQCSRAEADYLTERYHSATRLGSYGRFLYAAPTHMRHATKQQQRQQENVKKRTKTKTNVIKCSCSCSGCCRLLSWLCCCPGRCLYCCLADLRLSRDSVATATASGAAAYANASATATATATATAAVADRSQS